MKILDLKITNLPLAEVIKTIRHFLDQGGWHHLATVNPEFVVTSQRHPKFKAILSQTNLNLADGFGIQLAAFLTGQDIPTRITGIDLIKKLFVLAEKENKRIFLLGGKEQVANLVRNKLRKVHPNLIFEIISGGEINYLQKTGQWHENPDNLALINSFQPDILLVGLGHPKQELWLFDHKSSLPSVKLAMGIGGSLDFISGQVLRAPLIMRKIGLEWLFRLIRQPYRLKRIWEAIFVFFWLIITNKYRTKKR